MKHTNNNTEEREVQTEVIADGGRHSSEESFVETPFTEVSDIEVSRLERYKWRFQQWVYAPAKIIWSDWRARVGFLIICAYVLMGTLGVYAISAPDPSQGPPFAGPGLNWGYPLGTDNLGRAIHSQVVHATPPMLEMILAGAVFSTVVATVVGTFSGYKGGITDRVLMTLTDVMMTIPGLPLVIVLAVILEPRRPWVVGLILTVNAWAGLARAIRSQVLTLRTENYVEASRLIGLPTHSILRKDILPGLMPYVTVNFVNSARTVIFSSVGLYFLGVLPFTHFNWGVMMNLAYTTGGSLYTLSTAYWLFIPMTVIVILSFGLILFAQGTDRLFNPRVIARHTSPVEVEEESDEDMSGDVTTQIRG